MTSFTSLLNSIGGKKPEAPQRNPTTASSSATRSPTQPNGARPATGYAVAGVKRKLEDQATAPNAKIIKSEVKVPVRSVTQTSGQSSAPKPAPTANTPTTPYRGTARPAPGASGAPNAQKPIQKPAVSRPTTAPAGSSAPPAPNGAPKPKKGFAAVMERAKAAQEAAKAAGSSTIKHKPVEKLTKRDRLRQEEAARQKAFAAGKAGKLALADRSRSGTPVDAKGAASKKQESTYKGTMKKPEKKTVERQEFAYKGTMRKNGPGAAQPKAAAKKGMAQDKYGGYASWSDLDEAEDEEEEEGYESDASSDMMDAGFDDMEKEDRLALAVAKKEDQEALAEEERHRREKLERKKKLEALSKSAAAKKKY